MHLGKYSALFLNGRKRAHSLGDGRISVSKMSARGRWKRCKPLELACSLPPHPNHLPRGEGTGIAAFQSLRGVGSSSSDQFCESTVSGANAVVSKWPQRIAQFSLSPRERAGVRGKRAAAQQ